MPEPGPPQSPTDRDSADLLSFLRDCDAVCPQCGYSLRGLDRPVCPECHRTFSIAELRTNLETSGDWVCSIAPAGVVSAAWLGLAASGVLCAVCHPMSADNAAGPALLSLLLVILVSMVCAIPMPRRAARWVNVGSWLLALTMYAYAIVLWYM